MVFAEKRGAEKGRMKIKYSPMFWNWIMGLACAFFVVVIILILGCVVAVIFGKDKIGEPAPGVVYTDLFVPPQGPDGQSVEWVYRDKAGNFVVGRGDKRTVYCPCEKPAIEMGSLTFSSPPDSGETIELLSAEEWEARKKERETE
jgi:hypothetical protein